MDPLGVDAGEDQEVTINDLTWDWTYHFAVKTSDGAGNWSALSNAATVTTIGKVLGRRTMVVYLATVALSAFGGGLLLDWLMPRAAELVPQLSGSGHHHEGTGWFDHLGAVLLAVVMTRSWWLSRRRASCCEGECSMNDKEEPLEFGVEGMNCSHCSGSVQRAVEELFAKMPNKSVHPDEVVGMGAAVQAGVLGGPALGLGDVVGELHHLLQEDGVLGVLAVEILGAVGLFQGIKTAGQGQVLKSLFVGCPQVDPLGQVENR